MLFELKDGEGLEGADKDMVVFFYLRSHDAVVALRSRSDKIRSDLTAVPVVT